MKLIKQSGGSCLITSTAMVLNTDIKSLADMIGHDGSAVVLPLLPEPACRRGYHLQEIIDCALKLGYTVTPIEAAPYSTPDGKSEYPIDFQINNQERIFNYMHNSIGILTGLGKQWRHAMAWDGKHIYDPRGYIYSLCDCKIIVDCFWMFNKIKSVA